MVDGSMCAVVADAAVCCVDSQDDDEEEVVRQPHDMEGNVPIKRGPIGGVRPEMLNVTYFARLTMLCIYRRRIPLL